MAKKILVVDDSEVDAAIAKQALSNAGYVVELASNGRVAIDMIHEAHHADAPYAAVVTDGQMPVMSGIDLTRDLRFFGAFEHLPVLMCTGENEVFQAEAERAGVTEIFTKPVDLPKLVAVVKKYVGE